MKKLKVMSLFSGIGAFEKALHNLGIDFDLVGFSEIDKYAIKSFCAVHNVSDSLNLGDVSKVNIDDVPNFDALTYGFPCTDISISGKKEGMGEGSETRSSLLWECKKFISGKKPTYAIMENVDNLVKPKFKPFYDKWLDWMEQQGYTNHWKIMDSQDYGVPQRRKRVFLISILGEDSNFDFPEEHEEKYILNDFLDNNEEEHKYMSEMILPRQEIKKDGCIDIAYKDRVLRASCKKNYIQWDVNGKGQNSQADRAFYYNGVMGTIPAARTDSKVKVLLSNGRVRSATALECWKLQGFSEEDFNKAKATGNSNTQLYKQAGNSITVNVLEAIFKELFSEYIYSGVELNGEMFNNAQTDSSLLN